MFWYLLNCFVSACRILVALYSIGNPAFFRLRRIRAERLRLGYANPAKRRIKTMRTPFIRLRRRSGKKNEVESVDVVVFRSSQ